jgi:crossover junction endodeoxyribonuclease RuvC
VPLAEQVPSLVLLGVDPGLRVTGYGLVLSNNGTLSALDYGAFRTQPGDHAARLLQIYTGVSGLLGQWHVDELAVEQQFVAINVSSAFAVGEARATVMLAAALSGVPIFQYTPAEVKQAVTSYGRGGKEQVQEMVRLQLGLERVPQPVDAADALALAICHAALRAQRERMASYGVHRGRQAGKP